jgi:hypothetical protein
MTAIPTPTSPSSPTSSPAATAARRCSLRLAAAWAAAGGIAGNVLGVAFLWNVPSPYRPGDVPAWLAGIRAQPLLTVLSSASFVVGLALLAVFAALVVAAERPGRPGPFAAGWALVAVGAVLNAAGCVAPAVAVRFVPGAPDPAGAAVGQALLAVTLHLDAFFNLALGVGLVLANAAAGRPSGWPRALRAFGIAAGLASVPVSLQFWADPFAKLLAISGPLWLAWFAAAAVHLARGRAPAEPPG